VFFLLFLFSTFLAFLANYRVPAFGGRPELLVNWFGVDYDRHSRQPVARFPVVVCGGCMKGFTSFLRGVCEGPFVCGLIGMGWDGIVTQGGQSGGFFPFFLLLPLPVAWVSCVVSTYDTFASLRLLLPACYLFFWILGCDH